VFFQLKDDSTALVIEQCRLDITNQKLPVPRAICNMYVAIGNILVKSDKIKLRLG